MFLTKLQLLSNNDYSYSFMSPFVFFRLLQCLGMPERLWMFVAGQLRLPSSMGAHGLAYGTLMRSLQRCSSLLK